MAERELDERKLQVIADTRRAYWSLYSTVRAVEVTRSNREVLSRLHQVAEAKYKAGTVTQQDVLRALVELSEVDNRLLTLEQRRVTALGLLNSLLDRPVTAALPDPPVAEPRPVPVDLGALLSEASQSSPSIRKALDRIEAERLRWRLARLERWPDLTVGVTYNNVKDHGLSMAANGDDQWWLTFGVNLPVWVGKRAAAEREAIAGMREGAADLRDVENRVAFRVQEACARLDTQGRQVILLRDVILPQARQTLDATSSGYQAGQLDFLTLMDNWRKLLEFELMYHEGVSRLEQSVADLEQAVGRETPE